MDGVGKPIEWEKAVMAAYVVTLGGSQKRAAMMAGVCPRTVANWVHSDWWPDAKAEAANRWTDKARGLAMRALTGILREKDEATTRWALERLMPQTFGDKAPPAQQHDVTFTVIGAEPELVPDDDIDG